MKVAILGISGYTGLTLLRLLLSHPSVEDILPVSSSQYGKNILDIDPGLGEASAQKFMTTRGNIIILDRAKKEKCDVVFAALPHLKSGELCALFAENSIVIDLSADFRIENPDVYAKSYGLPPPKPELLKDAVYGLSEWYRDKIREKDIIANPGCYPTASLLPLLPLLKEGIVGGQFVINAISGISGAGKKLKDNLLFCERQENIGAYLPGKTHRHVTEIEQEIRKVDLHSDVLFTPHLAPLKRGMVVTTITTLRKTIDESDIQKVYKQHYSDCPFIKIRDTIPQAGDVRDTNRCDIFWHREGSNIMLFSAIDNLIKGASGQAVQNMNIRFGLDEKLGLKTNNYL